MELGSARAGLPRSKAALSATAGATGSLPRSKAALSATGGATDQGCKTSSANGRTEWL